MTRAHSTDKTPMWAVSTVPYHSIIAKNRGRKLPQRGIRFCAQGDAVALQLPRRSCQLQPSIVPRSIIRDITSVVELGVPAPLRRLQSAVLARSTIEDSQQKG